TRPRLFALQLRSSQKAKPRTASFVGLLFFAPPNRIFFLLTDPLTSRWPPSPSGSPPHVVRFESRSSRMLARQHRTYSHPTQRLPRLTWAPCSFGSAPSLREQTTLSFSITRATSQKHRSQTSSRSPPIRCGPPRRIESLPESRVTPFSLSR